MKIIKARITSLPETLFDPMPQVFATTEDGAEHFLFEYYPDEISFTSNEFVGLSLEEGSRLKFTKDQEYLRS
jgi:hypothetical protein